MLCKPKTAELVSLPSGNDANCYSVLFYEVLACLSSGGITVAFISPNIPPEPKPTWSGQKTYSPKELSPGFLHDQKGATHPCPPPDPS
jgi:hypothetical protein